MNKSKWLVFFLFWFATCGLKAQNAPQHKLLWEITGNNLQTPSYLFGTMHVADARVYNLPDSVFIAIENTAGFALEIDFDSMSYPTFAYLYESQGGSTWGELLSPVESEDAASDFEIDQKLLLDMFKYDKSKHPQEPTFLDAFLYSLAKTYKKEVSGLESIKEQLDLMANPDSGLDDDETNAPAPEGRKRLTMNRMIEIYEKGDLDQLDEYVNKSDPKGKFAQNVIIARNYVMATRGDSLMKVRSTFLGVGAAHLPGDEGVINLLRKRGYQLRPVVATYTGLNKTVREKPYSPTWGSFRRETEGFQLKVPTRPYPAIQGTESLTINLGMDLPGGIVFTFYAFPIAEGISSGEIEQKFDFLENSMRDKAYRILDSKIQLFKGHPSRTIKGKKGFEYFRARMVVANDHLYCLFWNGTEKIVDSPLSDEWFSSLQFFTPVKMTEQTTDRLLDTQWRYEVELPVERSVVNKTENSFSKGGNSGFYNTVKINDARQDQDITIHIEDYTGHYKRGELKERIIDCMYYYAEEELESQGDVREISSNGIRGLEGSYQNGLGKRYRLRCYLDANRLFFIGMNHPENDPDSTKLNQLFESFQPFPLVLPSLQTEFKRENFQLTFPQKPNTWTDYSNLWLEVLDSNEIAYYHDPTSSLNFSVANGHISKYYSGTADELFQATIDYAVEDSQFVVSQSDLLLNGLQARKMWTQNYDSTMLDAYLMVTAGEFYLEFIAQAPNTQEGRQLAEDFINKIEIATPKNVRELGIGKLDVLFLDLESDDSLQIDEATSALFRYKILPVEYEFAIASVQKFDLDSAKQSIANGLVYAFVEKSGDSALAAMKTLATSLKPTSANKIALLIKLLESNQNHDWALAEFQTLARDDQNISSTNFSWQDYLEADSTAKRFEELQFLLKTKSLSLRLAYDCVVIQEENFEAYAKYLPAVLDALDIAVINFEAFKTTWLEKLMISYLLESLAYEDVEGWEPLARKMIQLPNSFVASDGLTTLLQEGRTVSKAEVKTVCENPYARYYLIEWLFENYNTDILPKKYLKTDFLAEISLESRLTDFPNNLELLEKRKVFVDGYQQLLYIYRFSFPGESKWHLGFSGPFPLKGKVESLDDLYLTGEAPELYHPVRLEKQIKAWLQD